MRKIFVLTLTLTLLLFCSWAAYASPTDSGMSLNLTSRSADFQVGNNTQSDTATEYALTYGSWLGTTYKLKYGDVASNQYKFYSLEGNYYKGVGNGVSLILGMRNYGLEDKVADRSKSKLAIQGGAQFKQNFDKNTFGYASVLLGQNLSDYELGVGYKLTQNLSFDVNYRDLSIDNINLSNGEKDVESKGWGFGLTLKF